MTIPNVQTSNKARYNENPNVGRATQGQPWQASCAHENTQSIGERNNHVQRHAKGVGLLYQGYTQRENLRDQLGGPCAPAQRCAHLGYAAPLHVHRTSERAQNVRTCTEHAQNVHRTCTECAQNVHRACTEREKQCGFSGQGNEQGCGLFCMMFDDLRPHATLLLVAEHSARQIKILNHPATGCRTFCTTDQYC